MVPESLDLVLGHKMIFFYDLMIIFKTDDHNFDLFVLKKNTVKMYLFTLDVSDKTYN